MDSETRHLPQEWLGYRGPLIKALYETCSWKSPGHAVCSCTIVYSFCSLTTLWMSYTVKDTYHDQSNKPMLMLLFLHYKNFLLSPTSISSDIQIFTFVQDKFYFMVTRKERRQNRSQSAGRCFSDTTRKQIAQMRETEAQEGCISRYNKGIDFFLI